MRGADYDIPDVPNVLYFDRGYALHGAYCPHISPKMRSGEACHCVIAIDKKLTASMFDPSVNSVT